MRILLVNKFLYPRGGAETYVEGLGSALTQLGDRVQYFGMYDDNNTMRNDWGIYTSPVDFHRKSAGNALYPFRIIYSREAYRKMFTLLTEYKPDIIHLNNFNYQLTPSVIDAAALLQIPVVMTTHDSQFVCPNHLMYDPNKDTICTKCIETGDASWCMRTKCIHQSAAKSVIGTIEGKLYKKKATYGWISRFICPSRFMKRVYDTDYRFRGKTIYLQNFVDRVPDNQEEEKMGRGDYVLYFGRVSPEKGIRSIIAAARKFPDIPFVIAGSGPDEALLHGIPNLSFLGFKGKKELNGLVRRARLVVLPSTCYENNPLSVIEAQQLGAAVLAPEYGGAGELVPFGIKSPTTESFLDAFGGLYYDDSKLEDMRKDSILRASGYMTDRQYAGKIQDIYRRVIGDES